MKFFPATFPDPCNSNGNTLQGGFVFGCQYFKNQQFNMAHDKKHALITGGTSGIGYELAKLFAKDGYDLIIVARDNQELRNAETELTNNYGINVVSVSKDLSEPQSAFELYEEVVSMG
ncbi:MAG: SDR family NAD(P)-dependent oxidoreductase, partial [Ginsengibacter sp.]